MRKRVRAPVGRTRRQRRGGLRAQLLPGRARGVGVVDELRAGRVEELGARWGRRPAAGSSVRSSAATATRISRARRRGGQRAAPASRRSRAARRGSARARGDPVSAIVVRRPDAMSSRASARSREPATKTAPGAAARLSAPAARRASGPPRSRRPTLRRNTTSSGTAVTQTDPPATVIAESQPCSVARATIRLTAGSIFSTRPFSLLAAQRSPPANWSSVAVSGSGKRCCTRPVSRVDADDLGAAREPHRAGARGDPAGVRGARRRASATVQRAVTFPVRRADARDARARRRAR